MTKHLPLKVSYKIATIPNKIPVTFFPEIEKNPTYESYGSTKDPQ
jgi:hypothetical protein